MINIIISLIDGDCVWCNSTKDPPQTFLIRLFLSFTPSHHHNSIFELCLTISDV